MMFDYDTLLIIICIQLNFFIMIDTDNKYLRWFPTIMYVIVSILSILNKLVS